MAEFCNYKPMLDKVPGKNVTCPSNLNKSFKDNDNCTRCPKPGATTKIVDSVIPETFVVLGRKRERMV